MNYNDYPDDELVYLISEGNEEAKDILYDKYKFIIDAVFSKYKKACFALGLEYSDMYQEALLGFSDALASYREDKDTKISTFITLCVNRRLQVAVKRAGGLKHRMMNDSISLDASYGPNGVILEDSITDKSIIDPLDNLVKKELAYMIKKKLSPSEYQVFLLTMGGFSSQEIAKIQKKTLKSVDNTLQRIKLKIRNIWVRN